MTRLGLTLNAAKTCVREAWKEPFDFLGHTFGVMTDHRNGGRRYLGVRPSDKSVTRLKRKLHELLRPWNVGAWTGVAVRVNRILIGWSNYFRHGTIALAYRSVDNHVYDRVRHFLRRRHKCPSSGARLVPSGRSLRDWGIVRQFDVRMGRRRHASALG